MSHVANVLVKDEWEHVTIAGVTKERMDKEQKASGCESGDKMQVLKGSAIIPSSTAHVQFICMI